MTRISKLNKRSLFILIIFLLIVQNSVAEKYYWLKTFSKEWKKSDKTEFFDGQLKSSIFYLLDSIYNKNPRDYIFLFNGENLNVVIGCEFDFYTIKGNILESNYKYFNRGYTCGTTPFVRDSVNYMIGGYGFWMNHFDLLQFDKNHGSWELVNVKNQPLDYSHEGFFKNSKGLYALFGKYTNPRIDLKQGSPNGYFLDWENKEWKKLLIQIDGVNNEKLVKDDKMSFLETKDYLFMVFDSQQKNLGWNIIDKEGSNIFFHSDFKNVDVFLSPIIEVIDNKIFYQKPNGEEKSLDLDELISNSKLVGKLIVTDDIDIKLFSKPDVYYFLLLTLAIAFILMLAYKHKIYKAFDKYILVKNKKENNMVDLDFFKFLTTSEQSPIVLIELFIKEIKSLKKTEISTEEMDKILGLSEIESFDNKRSKRAKIIKEINLYCVSVYGGNLLSRVKNNEDKRFIYYHINTKLKSFDKVNG